MAGRVILSLEIGCRSIRRRRCQKRIELKLQKRPKHMQLMPPERSPEPQGVPRMAEARRPVARQAVVAQQVRLAKGCPEEAQAFSVVAPDGLRLQRDQGVTSAVVLAAGPMEQQAAAP